MSARIRRTAEVAVETTATAEQVWAVLADVTRVGEWSHECRTARWLDGADRADVGVRFRGANRAGLARWARPCTITEVEPGRRLAYRTHGGISGDSTEWRFTLEPTPGGCRIVQAYEILRLSRALEWAILKVVPQHEDRAPALRSDLERLGAVAAADREQPG